MEDQAQKLRELMNNSFTSSNSKTRIISVTSGKGGVGKTSISVNIALTYAKMGKKVVIIDADLGMANVNVMMGFVPKYNLSHIIKENKKMKDIIYSSNYGIDIVAGISGMPDLVDLEDKDRQKLVKELSELSYADIIIIDTGAGGSKNVLDFILASDDIVIVTTPEPTAITDAYAIIKMLSSSLESRNKVLKLIVNRSTGQKEAKKIADKITNIAIQFLNFDITYIGYLYEDQNVYNSVLKQKPFKIMQPKGKASICIDHIVYRLDNEDSKYYKEGNGFSQFLTKIFKDA